MTHLIDKDVLVAEIRKRLLPVIRDKHYNEYEEGQDSERIAILSIIDTLDVKDVDLEQEFDKCCENYIFDDECEVFTARRFFELGFKAWKEE